VLQLGKARQGMRPWIAVAAAYALALQLLLTGIAAAQAAAGPDAPAGGLFAICHGAGDNAAGDQDGTGKPPLSRSPCVLCTLTSAACAVLPTDHSIAFIDAKSFSDVFPWNDARMIQYDSPTGQYQTGPPARARISG
jgi:hypothetical protein